MNSAKEATLADKTPRYGGFSFDLILLETRRLLRNKRTMLSVLLMPVILSFIFTFSAKDAKRPLGVGNLSAFLVISLALYGAVQAASFGGSIISLERIAGWSRQLRTTPLSGSAYIAIKILTSYLIAVSYDYDVMNTFEPRGLL